LGLITRHSANRPLIVSHEMVGRMLLRHLLDLSPRDALDRHHPHDVVYEVRPHTRSIRELLPDSHDGNPGQ
jgi:probable phosphoglycerate mutase